MSSESPQVDDHAEKVIHPTEPGRAHRFTCSQCAAELEYAPGTVVLRCPYCGLRNEITPPAEGVSELDYVEHLEQLESEEPAEELSIIKCGACAAETERPPNLDSYQCPFCGADVLATTTSRRLIKPGAVLPFHVTPDAAHGIFRQWIAGRWFAPTKLKRFAYSDGQMKGVYLPFWTYDCRTETAYTGQRGEHYWVTETYTTMENGKSVTKTRQVRRTRWHSAAGRVGNVFDDLLILASRSLPEPMVGKLEPWDLPKLVPFRDEYMAGFRAETYQVGLAEGFGSAARLMEAPIRQTIRQDIGGDEQRIDTVHTEYFEVTFKHILLPVWLSAYRLGTKVFRFMINARTGELIGTRPYSAWKIAGLVAGVVGVIVVVVVMALVLGR